MSDRPDLPAYHTLAGPGKAELKVQRSRFIAYVAPATDEDAAREAVAAAARRHHDARHVCTAWRLGHADTTEARNDDGEPGGSAGEPILNALRSAGLVDVVAAVVRYFGGVKLGTGGLGRAYHDAAAAALEAAPRRKVLIGAEYDLDFPYDLVGSLTHLLEKHDGRVADSRFDDAVHWRIWLPAGREDAYAGAVDALTHGRVHVRPVEDPA